MKNSRFKEMIVNVCIFASLLALSPWRGGNIRLILPALAFLLLSNLIMELSRDLKILYRIPIYGVSLIFYPISYDFLRYPLSTSFIEGLVGFLIYLFFLRMVLSYRSSLFFHKSRKVQRHILHLLLSLDFGIIISFFQLETLPLSYTIRKMSLTYLETSLLTFSLEKALLFSLAHFIFFHLLDLLFPEFQNKK